MHSLESTFVGVFLAILSRTIAVPTGPLIHRSYDISSSRYLSPPFGLSTIPDLFTLSAITWEDPIPWTVIIADSRTDNGYQPVITREVFSEPEFEPSFTFQNGKLAIGPADDNLIGYFVPSPLVSPPLLEPFSFDNVTYDTNFYGVNNRDSTGTTYLELRTYYRNAHHTILEFIDSC